MYAVIRAGGKQYRVTPGDVIHIERQPAENGKLEFSDVLAASAGEGKIARPKDGGARVIGEVLEEGRAEKILVFHYKRKKQYKKLAGHRQPFSRVKITEIVFDGQSYKAPQEAAHEQKKSTKKSAPKHQVAAEHKRASAPHHLPKKEAAAKHKAKSGAKSSSKKKK